MTYSIEQLQLLDPKRIAEASQKHIESVVAELVETALAARHPLKRVGTIKSWTNGSYWRNYQVRWHSDALAEGTELYAEIPPPPGDAP